MSAALTDTAVEGVTPMRCSSSGSCEPEQLTLGLLHIGPMELAVPTTYLREAVDHPPRLAPLLTASPHVAGAIDVRGELIPVVDLRHALCLPPAQADDKGTRRRIVIIRHRHYLFGLVVDALGEVITVASSSCLPVEIIHPEAPPLIREVFSLDVGQRVVSMLCLDGVINQVDVPLTRKEDKKSDQEAVGARQQWSPYVLFECGQTRLAIHADHVDTVINLDGLAGGINRSDTCLGVIQSAHRRLAVLDALELLHLGHTDTELNRQVLVLKVGENMVGVLIRRVTQIARLDDGTQRPVPAMAFDAPEYFDGMLPLEGHGDFLKIAVQAFLGMTEVSSMASIHGRPMHEHMPGADTGHSGQPRRSQVYLTFKIAGETAALLRDIREILPLPQDITPIHRAGDIRIGLFTHRAQVLPIVDLAPLFGAPPCPLNGDTRLLLIESNGATVAMMVERVYAIEQAQWAHAPIAQAQWRGSEALDAAIHARSLLTLANGPDKRGVPALDLPRIAKAIEARYAPARPLQAAA